MIAINSLMFSLRKYSSNGSIGVIGACGSFDTNNSRCFQNLQKDHPRKVEGPKVGNLPLDLLVWVRIPGCRLWVQP